MKVFKFHKLTLLGLVYLFLSGIVLFYATDVFADPPVLSSISDKVLQEGQTLVIPKIVATDPDNDTLTIEIDNEPPGVRFFQTTSRAGYVQYKLRWPGNLVKPGVYTPTFRALDGTGGQAEQLVTITVNSAGNVSPVLNPINDKQGIEGQILVIPKIGASDSNGDTITIAIENEPPGVRFFQTDSRPGYVEYKLRWPGEYVTPGVHSITFTALDGNGGSDVKSADLIISNISSPPYFSPTPQDVVLEAGEAIDVTLYATDNDDGDVVYIERTGILYPWISALENLSGNDAQIRLTGSSSVPGTYPVTLRAKDARILIDMPFDAGGVPAKLEDVLSVNYGDWGITPDGGSGYECHLQGGYGKAHVKNAALADGIIKARFNLNDSTGNYAEVQLRLNSSAPTETPISSKSELISVLAGCENDTILSQHYYLTTDIDLEGDTSMLPIGSQAHPFTGSFDGRGFSITNYQVYGPSRTYLGLFAYIGASGVIKNLDVEVINSIYIDDTGRSAVGAVVGKNDGTISNCHIAFEDSITVNGINDGDYAFGALVGENAGRIYSCSSEGYNVGTVDSSNPNRIYMGHMVGRQIAGGIIDDCIAGAGAYNNITGGNNDVVGGLLGENSGGTISNSSAPLYEVRFDSQPHVSGGFVGINSGGLITGCFAIGNGVGGYIDVGGFAGRNENSGTLEDCYAIGEIYGSYNVGGFVGFNNDSSIIQNCYFASGTVVGDNCVGGLIGVNQSSEAVKNSYATGTGISGISTTGGLIGSNMNTYPENCWWYNGLLNGIGDGWQPDEQVGNWQMESSEIAFYDISRPVYDADQDTFFDEGEWDFTSVWVDGQSTYPTLYDHSSPPTDTDTGYNIRVSSDGVGIWDRESNSCLGTASPGPGLASGWHELRVDAEGDTIKVYVDDPQALTPPLLQVTNATDVGYGNIALSGDARIASAYFDDINIIDTTNALSVEEEFLITVLEPLLSINAVPQSGNIPLTVDFSANTNDFNPAKYWWNFGDGYTAKGKVPSPTHTYQEPGVYTVTLTAKESARIGGRIATAIPISIDVGGTTSPPVLNVVSPQEAQIFSSSPITVSGTATDDVGIDKVRITVKVDNGTVYDSTIATINGDAFDGTVNLREGANKLHVWAFDVEGYSAHEYRGIYLDTNAGNNPPVLSSIGNRQGAEGSSFTISSINATDIDGDELTMVLRDPPPGVRFFQTSGSNLGAVTYKMTWPDTLVEAGEYATTLIVFDENGATDEEIFTIGIKGITSTAISPQLVLAPREVQFQVALSSGWTPTCTWDFGDGNQAVGESVSYTYTLPGDYDVTLNVNDGVTDLNRDATIKVYDNQAPQNLGPRSLFVWTAWDAGDAEGWTAEGGLAGFDIIGDGALNAVATQTDSYMESSSLKIYTLLSKKVFVRCKVTDADQFTGKLTWKREGDAGFESASYETFSVINDGGFHTYELDLSSHPEWTGNIKQLRFYPTTGSSAHVWIDFIKVTEDNPAVETLAWNFNPGGEGIVSDATQQDELLDFCFVKGISLVFLNSQGVACGTSQDKQDYTDFINKAHSKSIDVYGLQGRAWWSIPEGQSIPGQLNTSQEGWQYVDAVIAYGGFDGVIDDTEPYVVDDDGWSDNLAQRVQWYLAWIDGCVSRVGQTPFISVTPFWFDGINETGKVLNEEVSDRVDSICIMDYRDFAEGGDGIISHAENEVTYAKSWIAVETNNLVPNIYADKLSFYEEGEAYMEAELLKVKTYYDANANYEGISIHYYIPYRDMAP